MVDELSGLIRTSQVVGKNLPSSAREESSARPRLRSTFLGTHQGELMGIPPTGKASTMAGISIYHLANGMIADFWESYDKLGLLQQLGVIPA